jgi:serine O-acetyltransferase
MVPFLRAAGVPARSGSEDTCGRGKNQQCPSPRLSAVRFIADDVTLQTSPATGRKGEMPIRSWDDYRRYLAADLRAYDPRLDRWRPWVGIKYPQLAWQRKLRLAELMLNRASGPVSRAVALAFRLRARTAGIKLGFSIPPNVFGPGLCIVHWGTIVVNDRARVGARCRIHPGTVIGGKDEGVPVLGDDCYLGPGCKLIGPLVLGNDVKIGANAVVTKSFPDGVTLVGVPAQVMTHKERLLG